MASIEARAAIAEYRAFVLQPGDEVIGEHTYIIPQPQASCVIIDQTTGYVKAIVGGRGKKEASLTLSVRHFTVTTLIEFVIAWRIVVRPV